MPSVTTTTTTTRTRTAPAPPVTAAATATAKELQDIKALCCCLSISQFDNYSTWLRVGMILKMLGAPLSLWEEASKRSNKYKHGDCCRRWGGFHTQFFSIGSLFALAKEGNAEMLERSKPTLNMNKDVVANDAVYHDTEIDTPSLLWTQPIAERMLSRNPPPTILRTSKFEYGLLLQRARHVLFGEQRKGTWTTYCAR